MGAIVALSATGRSVSPLWRKFDTVTIIGCSVTRIPHFRVFFICIFTSFVVQLMLLMKDSRSEHSFP